MLGTESLELVFVEILFELVVSLVIFINGKLDINNNTWTANKEAPKTSLRVFTDDNGVFAFVPSRAGQWVIRAVASMDREKKVVHDASLVVQFE